jgi:LysM repeat protein
MRRTKIFRSREVLAAVVIGALAAPLAAQAPPPIQRPIDQARRVQGQASQNVQRAEQAGQEQAEGRVQAGAQALPASHIVQQGETLWQLAQQYFGDPLLWPELYRLNTDVIEDPHWIYPGEELRLAPVEVPDEVETAQQPNITVTPEGDSVPPQVEVRQPRVTAGPTIFSPRPRTIITGTEIDARVTNAYRAVREGEYYASGFLTEGERLETGRILASAQSPSRASLRISDVTRVHESVVLSPPPGTTVDTGSLMLAFRRSDEVPGFGQIVVPTGLVRVYDNSSNRHLGEVVRQFERVLNGQELLPIAPFRMESNAHAVPVENGLEANVLRSRDSRQVAGLQSVLFLDKGANQGVRLGDVFAVSITLSDGQGGTLVQDQARVLVVGTRDRSSTAIIIELYRGDVGSRSQARLVRRLPS